MVPSAKRSAALPDVPTSVEQGMPNFLIDGWFAVIGPAKMPAGDVKRIHAGWTAAAAAQDVKDAMEKQGNIINPMTPEASAAYFRSEYERFARLVKKANVKVD
jgi:tripartite-type tricarboxylate transporter receptor subunit TctC